MHELVVRLVEADVEKPGLAERHAGGGQVGWSVGDARPEDRTKKALDASHRAEGILQLKLL